MKSLITSKLQIGIHKHSHESIGLWRWCVCFANTYGLGTMGTTYLFKTAQEAKTNFEEFAKLNGISDFEWFGEGTSVQDIRTDSGAMV